MIVVLYFIGRWNEQEKRSAVRKKKIYVYEKTEVIKGKQMAIL